MYGCLLEGKRHQSLAKPDKLKYFSNEPKQTELAKQKHGMNTMHTKNKYKCQSAFLHNEKMKIKLSTFG